MLSALKNGLQSWLGKRREPAHPTPEPAAAGGSDTAESAESADDCYAQGLEHRRLGRREEALAAFERAVEIRSDHAPALVQQGELCHELGRREEASDAFALALAHDPTAVDARIAYGRLLRDCELAAEAVTHLRRAVELAPASAAAWMELGLALNQAGRTDEAMAAYERAIALAPGDPGAYVNLGLIQLAQRGDAARAEILFREAAARAPAMLEPSINIGLALHEQDRSEAALAHFDAMLRADPACVEARWHRAGVRLALEDYERGWDDYEARKVRGEGKWRVAPPLPEWDGKPVASGTLLVYAEQGVGDEIMFASCLPEAIAAAPRCVVECEPRLAALLARSFPQARVCGVTREDHSAWLGELRGAAVQCAIGSLPRFFRRSSASFEGRGAYLHADPQRVARWRAALDAAGGALKVGIAWRGGTLKTRRELRSTALAEWMPVLRTGGAHFHALHADAEDEIAALGAHECIPITPLPAGTDLDELAALISALDLVITVQGTTAHLAGALGRPVWILLNRSAEWRYLAAGARMPWYPSATLVRQPAAGDWPAVFGEAAAMLARRVAERTPCSVKAAGTSTGGAAPC